METKAADAYTRANVIALEVFDDRGQDPFNGVGGRTLHALARRGLVWFEVHDRGYTGGLTDKGRTVLAELNAKDETDE